MTQFGYTGMNNLYFIHFSSISLNYSQESIFRVYFISTWIQGGYQPGKYNRTSPLNLFHLTWKSLGSEWKHAQSQGVSKKVETQRENSKFYRWPSVGKAANVDTTIRKPIENLDFVSNGSWKTWKSLEIVDIWFDQSGRHPGSSSTTVDVFDIKPKVLKVRHFNKVSSLGINS